VAILFALVGALSTLGIVLLVMAIVWSGRWPLRVIAALFGLALVGVALLILDAVLRPL
jgi:hypothetical protein